MERLREARTELRRQLRDQKRVRAAALGMVVLLVLGAPMIYFGILFATRDPVLNSLDRLRVPTWAAQSPEDRIISGSRWCFVDCRLRQRNLVSERETAETAEVYKDALRDAGWTRWEVEGCPPAAVDGDFSCWTRDEYTLELWVRPPDCAYDPRYQRPDPGDGEGEDPGAGEDAPGDGAAPQDDCSGSAVEIKMRNRVADERRLVDPDGGSPGPAGDLPTPPGPTGAP